MDKKIIQVNSVSIAVISSNELIINDVQSALDFAVSIQYNDNCYRIAINKQAVIEDFFKLSTGIAGEILQAFVNYSIKLAVVGDFSVYTSKALKDFIYESNNGKHVFFVADEQTAIEKLSKHIGACFSAN